MFNVIGITVYPVWIISNVSEREGNDIQEVVPSRLVIYEYCDFLNTVVDSYIKSFIGITFYELHIVYNGPRR